MQGPNSMHLCCRRYLEMIDPTFEDWNQNNLGVGDFEIGFIEGSK